jgi:guanylate kinase
MGKLILLTGPSCVGKGPLIEAVYKFYPEIISKMPKLVLFNSRQPRPGEKEGVDYYFRRRDQIESLQKQQDFVVCDVRGDLQAIDLKQFFSQLEQGDVFFEGNPLIVESLLGTINPGSITQLKIFLSPLSREEIEYFKSLKPAVSLPSLIMDIMRRKLLRRTQRQKGVLSGVDLVDIERRAGSAFGEMKFAAGCDAVIPNYDGEDSENWNAFYYPVGAARKTMECFATLLRGQSCPSAENWPHNLLEGVE